ncbi:MAG: XRE family transcriptional regulator, partial [Cytophagaceae bacterium]
TQEELAELLGIDKVRVSKHEGGKTNPTVETLQKIFSVLDVSVTLTIKKK